MPLPVINSFTGQEYRDRSIADRIWQCDTERDLVLLGLIGGTNGAAGKFRITSVNDNYLRWYSTGGRPTATTLSGNEAALSTTGDDAFGDPVYAADTFGVANATIFAPGMVLELPRRDTQAPEFVHVNSISGNNLNVTRGWRGTPVYAYVTGQEIGVLTIVAEECDTGTALPALGFTSDSNYFQTFIGRMEDTKRRQHMSKSFLDWDPYEEELMRLIGGSARGRRYTGLLPTMIERTAFYGIPSPGGAQGDSSMGGINSFAINQYVTPTLNLKFFNSVAKQLHMNGAMVDGSDVLVSPDIYEMISYWGYGTLTTASADRSVGVVVDKIVTPFGVLNIRPHRHLRPNELYILDTEKIGMHALWDWETTDIPQANALCYAKDLTACYTMLLACPTHHARIRVDSTCLSAVELDPGVVAPFLTEPATLEPGVVVA